MTTAYKQAEVKTKTKKNKNEKVESFNDQRPTTNDQRGQRVMSYVQRSNEQYHVSPANSTDVMTFHNYDALQRFTKTLPRIEYAAALKFGAKLQMIHLEGVTLTPDVVAQTFIRSYHPILNFPGCQYEDLQRRAISALKLWWIFGDKLPVDNENETE